MDLAKTSWLGSAFSLLVGCAADEGGRGMVQEGGCACIPLPSRDVLDRLPDRFERAGFYYESHQGVVPGVATPWRFQVGIQESLLAPRHRSAAVAYLLRETNSYLDFYDTHWGLGLRSSYHDPRYDPAYRIHLSAENNGIKGSADFLSFLIKVSATLAS